MAIATQALANQIFHSALFLDSSHYNKIYKSFKESVKSQQDNWEEAKDKFEFLQKHFQWEEIPSIYQQRFQKSKKLSESFKVQGNESYKAGNFADSLRYYNLSLLFAPQDSELKYLAIANRSAVLLQIGEYETALKDCDVALTLVDKTEIKVKLENRREKLIQLLKSEQFFENKKNAGENFFKNFKLGKENTFYKGASEDVIVDYDEFKGRKLVAARDVKAGTLILSDPGYILHLDKHLTWDTWHCAQCGKITVGGIVGESVFSLYCNNDCLKLSESSQFHKILPYFHCTEELHDCLLIVKIILKEGIGYFQNFQKEVKNQIECCYNSTDFSTVYGLITHKETDTEEDLDKHFKSIFISNIFQQYFSSSSSKEIEKYLPNIIYKLQNNLKYNVITLSQWTVSTAPVSIHYFLQQAKEKSLEIKTISYATSVFPLVALCNHSCDPNSSFLTHPKVNGGMLVTTRHLRKGQEFCISYKAPFVRMDHKLRQNYLKQNYKFDCDCWACINKLNQSDIKPPIESDFPTMLQFNQVESLIKTEQFQAAFDILLKILNSLLRDGAGDSTLVQLGQELMRRVMVQVGQY